MESVQLTFVTTPGLTVPTIAGIGAVVVQRDADGTPCSFAFPAPFEDLQVTHGEPVTAALVTRMHEALRHFGAQP